MEEWDHSHGVAAVGSVLGMSSAVYADTIPINFTARFSLTNCAADLVINPTTQDPAAIPGVGTKRTPLSGAAIIDTVNGSGLGSLSHFSFLEVRW